MSWHNGVIHCVTMMSDGKQNHLVIILSRLRMPPRRNVNRKLNPNDGMKRHNCAARQSKLKNKLGKMLHERRKKNNLQRKGPEKWKSMRNNLK